MAGKILGRLSPGDIIVLHEGGPRGKKNRAPGSLKSGESSGAYREKGLEPAPLSVLLSRDIMRTHCPGDRNRAPATNFLRLARIRLRPRAAPFRRFPSRRRGMEIVLPRLREIFTGTGRVLEVGAGTGLYSLPIAELCRKLVAVRCFRAHARKASGKGRKNLQE